MTEIVALRRDDGVSDDQLVARVRSGDRWAEDVLVRRHFPAVAATAARLLGDREEAQDVAQDAFATAIAELPNLRHPGALRGWLLQITVRQVHRRFRRRKLMRMLGLWSPDPEAGLAELVSEDASPEERAELSLLDNVLATLPTSERIAWSLRHVEGMQLEDVASAAGCSLATAKRRIAAAEKLVRAHVALEEP